MTTTLSDCQNCRTPLHGAYCHQCGQSAHNPNKHFGHALEEVFESFWHLDGRIFRTVRDLWIPGRVAANYLAGQRVGYVQPLRLFVILTVFTFFVMKLTVSAGALQTRSADVASAPTPAATVEAERDQTLAQLRSAMGDNPALAPVLHAAQASVESAAAEQIAHATDAPRPAVDIKVALPKDGERWDPKADPVHIALLPAFANDYLNQRLQRMDQNVRNMGDDASQYFTAMLTAIPGALFVLMPLFALVLRVAYAGRDIGYLEHLVVALYSHAWLLMVLLIATVVGASSGASRIVAVLSNVINGAALLAVPVYLALMQQRVYGGRRWLTALRYLGVGTVYLMLVGIVVAYATLAGISS